MVDSTWQPDFPSIHWALVNITAIFIEDIKQEDWAFQS